MVLPLCLNPSSITAVVSAPQSSIVPMPGGHCRSTKTFIIPCPFLITLKIVLFTNSLASNASFEMRQSYNFSFILKENLRKSAFVQNVKCNLSSGSRLTAHPLALFSPAMEKMMQWP